MIAYYEFKALLPDKANELLSSMDHKSTNTEMTLADIFNYYNKGFNETESRKIGFQK